MLWLLVLQRAFTLLAVYCETRFARCDRKVLAIYTVVLVQPLLWCNRQRCDSNGKVACRAVGLLGTVAALRRKGMVCGVPPSSERAGGEQRGGALMSDTWGSFCSC